MKCTNCSWEGEHAEEMKCPICGDWVKGESKKPEQKPIKKKEPNYDLNNDGVVDEKDTSFAAKVMAKARGNKKKPKRKRK